MKGGKKSGGSVLKKAGKAVKSVKSKGIVKAVTGMLGGKSRGGAGVKVSAKRMLKKAYERKAKHMIRIGNLGQARRILRKKATVV